MSKSTPTFTRKAAVTLPVQKIAIDVACYVKVDAIIFQGQKLESDKNKDSEAAYLMTVTNLETGEQGQIVLNKVLKSIFEDFENEGVAKEEREPHYVGRGFEITKHKKASGKDYNTFTVYEIDLPA